MRGMRPTAISMLGTAVAPGASGPPSDHYGLCVELGVEMELEASAQ